MTVKVSRPSIDIRGTLDELNKPSGIAGNAMLAAETPQEQFNLIGAGRKNLIINGAMQVAQRGANLTGVTTSTYSVDRWQWNLSTGTFNLSQAEDGPDGFPTCYSVTCTGTGTTSAIQYVRQRFEGNHTYHLANGTSGAKATTLSFWVKSNSTGTYPVLLVHHSSIQRDFVMTYTINQADTWEKKTFTIAGDINGGSYNNTTMEMSVDFILSGNNGVSTEATEVWKPRNTQNAANLQTAPAINGATGRYWNITGVQWELGSVATPFEHRSYGEELALCQRYYETSNGAVHWATMTGNTNIIYMFNPVFTYAVAKRAIAAVAISTSGVSYQTIGNSTSGFDMRNESAGTSGPADKYLTWTADAEL